MTYDDKGYAHQDSPGESVPAAMHNAMHAQQQAASDLIGRLDKPFHLPECKCDECLRWIADNPLPQKQQAVSVRRYDTQLYSSTLYEKAGGRFVEYADYEKAIAERDAAQRECERLKLAKNQKVAVLHFELEESRRHLKTANESIRKMGEAADAERQRLVAEVERLKARLL